MAKKEKHKPSGDIVKLRIAVNTFEDFQRMRVRHGNRLKLKKSGEKQIVPESQIGFRTAPIVDEVLLKMYNDMLTAETNLLKLIEIELAGFPIYTEFLSGIKGVGPRTAGAIIAAFDIHRADTVSKMWAFAGMNPGMVRGMKFIKCKNPKKYKPKEGYDIVRIMEQGVVVRTDEMVRGDKKKEGFLSPFNGRLRTLLCGILAESFVKQKSPYAMEHYYPYKHRLENHAEWSKKTKAHRHRAAIRHMMSMFLIDLYKAWRELEGLPVRVPYSEEYLRRKHNAKVVDVA